jgi:hypothetical protein
MLLNPSQPAFTRITHAQAMTMSAETSPQHATHLASSYQNTPISHSLSHTHSQHSLTQSQHSHSHSLSHSSDASQILSNTSFASSSDPLGNGSSNGNGNGNGNGDAAHGGTLIGAGNDVGMNSSAGSGMLNGIETGGMEDDSEDLEMKEESTMDHDMSQSGQSLMTHDNLPPTAGSTTTSGGSSASSTSKPKATPSKGKNGATGPADGKAKPHICQICQRGFTTGGHLQRHQRIHTGVKAFKCPHPGCETRTSRQDNLQQQ